jgi:thymidylate synthase
VTRPLNSNMYIVGDTLDDLLHRVFSSILKSGEHVEPSRGECLEKVGVHLKLNNPRARLSRTERRGELLFGCLGELCWYLSGSHELSFIQYYLPKYADESDDGKTIHGAYGPRLFEMRGALDQIANVTHLLRAKPSTRRAVVQLFDASDLVSAHKEIPCTCTLQLMVRKQRLIMLASMRSNDAYKGLPHDVFAFTMLQELMARTLGIELGEYHHLVGSLHLYKQDLASAKQFIDEGWQPTAPTMPSMPIDDPWTAVRATLKAERALRRGNQAHGIEDRLDPYWADIVRLLRIFRAYKNRDQQSVRTIRGRMSSTMFDKFIRKKQEKAGGKVPAMKATQPSLFDVPPFPGRRGRL